MLQGNEEMKVESEEVLFEGFVTLKKQSAEGVPFDMIVLEATDSVAGLLYNEADDSVLLVRQDRAPMIRCDNPEGTIVESVAGRFDVDIDARELLKKEALEEVGVELNDDLHSNN